MNFNKFPLIKRLIPSLRKNLRLFLKKHIFWTKINDINYMLDIRQKQDREFYFKKNYEVDNFNFIYKNNFFDKSFIFVDIGCNIGIYTLIIGKNFKNCKKIVSIEPVFNTFKRLRSNVKINKIENITTLLNIALSNKDGKAKMRSVSKHNQIQLSKYEINESGDVDVETKVFDNLYKFEKEYIFIKCDVEGHELKTIEGMKNTLSKNNCLIQIEIFSESYKITEKLLNSLNYFILYASKERDTYFFGKNILN
tara:strand:+ start:587 stop:1342 length:756 start_codon:yes stop_codon:yes gene_type:complete